MTFGKKLAALIANAPAETQDIIKELTQEIDAHITSQLNPLKREILRLQDIIDTED